MAKSSARLAYSCLFFLSLVLSWVLRDSAKPLLMKLPCARCGPSVGQHAAQIYSGHLAGTAPLQSGGLRRLT